MDKYCLTTGQATLRLLLWAREINPLLAEIDWYSFLRENRRDPASNSAVERRSVRGNAHIFGIIPHCSGGGRVRYSVVGLKQFIEKLRCDPGLVAYLLRRVDK